MSLVVPRPARPRREAARRLPVLPALLLAACADDDTTDDDADVTDTDDDVDDADDVAPADRGLPGRPVPRTARHGAR